MDHIYRKAPTDGGGPPRQRAALALALLFTLVVVGLVAGHSGALPAGLWQWGVPQTPAEVPEPTPAPTLAPTPEPTPDPAQQRIEKVLATMEENCTGAAPQLTDPATWNERGRALMDRLEADPDYQAKGFTAMAAAAPDLARATVQTLLDTPRRQRPAWTASTPGWEEALAAVEPAAAQGYPYLLAVNRAASTVTVYRPDAQGRYTEPYMAMVCSGGADTPLGFWSTPIRHDWRLLTGPCYGQYATRIWNGYLFHSVPYYNQFKDDLEYDQFNQLGTAVSLGCIRLAVVDVKWIYDNCPPGTPVVIYDDAKDPGPMGKPGTIYTDPEDEALRGWDPTDPDARNPWPQHFRSGTAIRSADAQTEYDAAQSDGRWLGSINPGALQGFSTDSSIVGTRG